MTHMMNITTDGSERAIVRTLAVIEQRGFQVSAIDFPYREIGEQSFRVRVKARDAQRSIEVLARKISAMHTVRMIEICPSEDLRLHNQHPGIMTQSMTVNGHSTMKEVVQ